MSDPIARFLAGIPMPLVVIGADGLLAHANAPACALLNVAAPEGRPYGLFIRNPELLAAIEAALQGAPPRVLRLVTPGAGQDRVHEVTVTGEGGRVLLAFADLSAAEQIDQMRRDFVANVSHELRTPLTALLGFIETLQGAARHDAPARERFLGIMATEAERMNRLVRDLLHLSRVEADERIRPETTVDIAGLARGVIDALRPLADGLGVGLVLEAVDRPLTMRADGDQMVQVMSNLVENAVKYGSPPGSVVRVRLAPEDGPRGPQMRLSVQDQGAGIDPRHIPRLTERFYRVDNHRSRQLGGTGLGLAIVKHIVQRHKGRLMIESSPENGSKFSILLPIS